MCRHEQSGFWMSGSGPNVLRPANDKKELQGLLADQFYSVIHPIKVGHFFMCHSRSRYCAPAQISLHIYFLVPPCHGKQLSSQQLPIWSIFRSAGRLSQSEKFSLAPALWVAFFTALSVVSPYSPFLPFPSPT